MARRAQSRPMEHLPLGAPRRFPAHPPAGAPPSSPLTRMAPAPQSREAQRECCLSPLGMLVRGTFPLVCQLGRRWGRVPLGRLSGFLPVSGY